MQGARIFGQQRRHQLLGNRVFRPTNCHLTPNGVTTLERDRVNGLMRNRHLARLPPGVQG